MIDNNLLRELSRRLSALVPAAKDARDELRTKMEQTLKSVLQEFDLLTREEFETQSQALKRAEQRIQELELLLDDLEKRVDGKSS